MTVTVSDLGSGVDTAAWMLSDTVFASQDAITGSWTDLSLTDGSGSFSIQPGQKGYAYLRVTDRAGNITVLNSDGVVVYTDAQADTRQITYVKRSGQDVSFHVALNGNTVTGVQLAGGAVREVSGVFVALGVAGSTALARKLGAAVEGSRIVVDDKMQTTVPGLYAAGDCTGGLLQVAKAVYEGALAGTEAAKALRKG